MHDPFLVNGGERATDVRADLEGASPLDRTAHDRAQRSSCEQLHHDEETVLFAVWVVGVVLDAAIEEADDVRMLQLRERVRLRLKARDERRVARRRALDDLQR